MSMVAAQDARTSQRDDAYASLRARLILQQIPEGERLSEPAWARTLGVSRSAIREALARLEAEGLIVRAATAGYSVPVLSEADVREILEVRWALESGAIDTACAQRRCSPAHLAPLIQAIEQHATFVAQGYRLGASEADQRFHHRLVDLAGNRRLAEMYRRAPLPLIHRLLTPTSPPGMVPVEEHRAIVEAIRKGDPESARQHLRHHLARAMASSDAVPAEPGDPPGNPKRRQRR